MGYSRIIFIFFVMISADIPVAEANTQSAMPAYSGELPSVEVHADHTPPLRFYDSNGVPAGQYIDEVHAFMAQTGLDYQIVLSPWSRAYARAMNDPYALVFNLDRITEREDQFIWLKSLRVVEYRVFTRNDPELTALSLEQAISEGRTVLCERASAQCQMALQLGFKPEQLVEFVDAASRTGPAMLVRGRADFFLTNGDILETGLLRSDIRPDQIVPMFDPIIASSWIAIYKGANPTLVKHLNRLSDQSDDLARD